MTWPRYGKVVAVPHLCQMQLQAKDTGRSGIAVSPPVLCVDRLPRDAERVPDLLPRAAALPRGVAAGRQVTAVSTRRRARGQTAFVTTSGRCRVSERSSSYRDPFEDRRLEAELSDDGSVTPRRL